MSGWTPRIHVGSDGVQWWVRFHGAATGAATPNDWDRLTTVLRKAAADGLIDFSGRRVIQGGPYEISPRGIVSALNLRGVTNRSIARVAIERWIEERLRSQG